MGSDIQVIYEATIDSETMRFIVTTQIASETVEFSDPALAASRSPLASKLFGFPWCEKVKIAPDSIYLTKQSWVEWTVIAEPLSHLIKEHIETNQGVLVNAPEPTSAGSATSGWIEFRAEPTPNPESLKFNATRQIADDTFFVEHASKASRSPLAGKLLAFPWAKSVFIGTDFVTVTKQDFVEWEAIQEAVIDFLENYVNQGEQVLYPEMNADIDDNDPDVVKSIKQILNQEIRPAVAKDGGDIIFGKYDNGKLYLQMQGSCQGCPSSTLTLKHGIETRLKQSIPDLEEVIAM
ncbi:MAG: hypothetical protein CL675_07095 [Bdellovibrionaceae bacterium]|nr:hypothetical protein [Pseudobdellovibrionaceae bacterium]